eukprot:TRINITY_DN1727_c0_g2_i1.p2 TRINITY_DN1727_c0_g2~~TRINITY_DN1727_c0_g2_i1.p2  ORF type:complete len:135 (+),score=59.35 TRINITY_DN1727_c0_g2_i1:609-1013(+)
MNKSHVVPTQDTENWTAEQQLKKIATAGVVKLFNAVKKQQKSSQAGGGDEKSKDSLTKEKFMELLQGSKGKTNNKTKETQNNNKKTQAKKDEEPQWGVLSDNYMLGAKLKDWKDDDDEGDNMIDSDQEHGDDDE